MKKHAYLSLTAVLVCLVLLTGCQSSDWPAKFKTELDTFFGAEQWQVLSEETKDSNMYSVYYRSRNTPSLSGERKGKYHDWDIGFTNRNGETEAWRITDHALRINHDKYGRFSKKRFTAKQALGRELMDISCVMAGQAVRDELLQDILSQNERDCLRVEISYHGGNPKPEMYDKLLAEPWFTANTVTAEDFLQSDLHDFYIDIHAHDYLVAKLSEQEQAHLVGSLDAIEQALQSHFGDYADYDMYLGEGYSVEFTGTKATP